MPTLVLRFPGGRYHATPNGHHVNEGLVDWPPSPWRLVRALIACGYSTQQWEQVPAAGRRLVEALSSTLPEYRLPRAVLSHSRHFMPIGVIDKGREKTTLVLDAFADVADGPLCVRWPTKLDEEAQKLFEVLVTHLGYLGRGESWVLGESISDDVPLPETGRAFPHHNNARPTRHFEQITLTAPTDPNDYIKWKQSEVDGAIRALNLPLGKKPTPSQQKRITAIQAAYPDDLVACLQTDTAWWRAHKWSQAPGTQSILYWREAGALEVGPPSSPHSWDVPAVEMMLLALTTASGSRSTLPPIMRTLPQAELLHRAMVSKLRFDGNPCPELVGRDETGEPLKGHRHAYVLPVDLDSDGHLDHVIVWARMGLGARAQRAVRSLRKTYMKDGIGVLQVAVAGVGDLSNLRAIGGKMASEIDKLLGPAGGATSWVSATPLVPPRHLKKQGRSSLAGQVEAELKAHGLPSATVEILEWTGETLALRHFVRRRQRGPQPPIDVGFALRLQFDRPVIGPVSAGYGSHFGLGRFSAE
jgi:CRISPR-associated protein Csb2